MVQQRERQRLLIDCQTEQSASVCACVDNSSPGGMTVRKELEVSPAALEHDLELIQTQFAAECETESKSEREGHKMTC